MQSTKQLLSLYIAHDSDMQTLANKALSQLILKTVLIQGQITYENLLDDVESRINTRIIKNHFQLIVKTLVNKDKLIAKGKLYEIHPNYAAEANQAVIENDRLHNSAIDRWFKRTTTKPHIVRSWFETVNTQFFVHYKANWINQICYGTKESQRNNVHLNTLIEDCLNNSEVDKSDYEWLKSEYLNFLESTNIDDQSLLWNYSTAMFSAVLIQASTDADNFTAEIFKNSTIYLDTNLLLMLSLNEAISSTSVSSLEKILLKQNVHLKYFKITGEEYFRVWGSKRSEILSFYNKISEKTLKELDDSFISWVFEQKYESVEDIKSLFENIKTPPTALFENLKIELDDDQKLNEIIAQGSMDYGLQEKINKIYLHRRGFEKKALAKQHDSGIIHGMEYLREQGINSWFLTYDGSLSTYASQNCIRNEHPVAITMTVLINLLAYLSPESDVEKNEFAQMFSHFVKFSLHPDNREFQKEDLLSLLDIYSKVEELPTEKQIEYAKHINKLRLSGESKQEIQLAINRQLQKDRLAFFAESEYLKTENTLLKADLNKIQSDNSIFLTFIKSGLIKSRTRKIYLAYIGKIIASIIIPALLIYLIILWLLPNIKSDDPLITILARVGCGLIGSFILTIFKSPKYYKEKSLRLSKLDEDITREVEKMRTK